VSTNPNPDGRCWGCHGPLAYNERHDTYYCRACELRWDQEDLYFSDGKCGCDNCRGLNGGDDKEAQQ